MKKIIAGLSVFLLTAVMIIGCGTKKETPGIKFLKTFNLPDIKVKSIDLKEIGQRDYTKNYNNPNGNVSPNIWKNQFMRAIAEYTKVTISDEAAETYINGMDDFRDVLTQRAYGEMFYRYSDKKQLGFSDVEKGMAAYDYWLNASKIMIKRVLGVDAVAKAKKIQVSDDVFAAFCRDYQVNTQDEKEMAFARYCCLEDMVVRAYLPANAALEFPDLLPEAFDTGFIDLSDY